MDAGKGHTSGGGARPASRRPALSGSIEQGVTVAIGDRHPWPALDQPAAIGGGMLDGLPYMCGNWSLIDLAFLTGCVTVEANTCGESTVGERSAKHNKPAADELNQTLLVGLSSLSLLLLANLTGLAIFVYGIVQAVGLY